MKTILKEHLQKILGENEVDNTPLKVNNHIHSPYSFSAFNNIEHAVKLAVEENIAVLGINDFFVTDGYNEFYSTCNEKGVYPLFNVEFIGLHKQFQEDGIRVNDPNNPGRIYLSGKGLKRSFKLSAENQQKFDTLIEASQQQIIEMIAKLNEWLQQIDAQFSFTYDEIKAEFAKELVRERHIASAIRKKVDDDFCCSNSKSAFYSKLFGTDPGSDISNKVAIEEEIRSKLLKAGGKAFVPEDERAFLSPSEIKAIIENAGGIITYPLLLDDKNGNYTDFEENKEELAARLIEMGISGVEFIPGRNTITPLKEYSEYFYNRGFLVSYGTEHNSPAVTPLEVSCKNNTPLDKSLLDINYKCACIIAAHQYLLENGLEGYIDTNGNPKTALFEQFIELGNALIKKIKKP